MAIAGALALFVLVAAGRADAAPPELKPPASRAESPAAAQPTARRDPPSERPEPNGNTKPNGRPDPPSERPEPKGNTKPNGRPDQPSERPEPKGNPSVGHGGPPDRSAAPNHSQADSVPQSPVESSAGNADSAGSDRSQPASVADGPVDSVAASPQEFGGSQSEFSGRSGAARKPTSDPSLPPARAEEVGFVGSIPRAPVGGKSNVSIVAHTAHSVPSTPPDGNLITDAHTVAVVGSSVYAVKTPGAAAIRLDTGRRPAVTSEEAGSTRVAVLPAATWQTSLPSPMSQIVTQVATIPVKFVDIHRAAASGQGHGYRPPYEPDGPSRRTEFSSGFAEPLPLGGGFAVILCIWLLARWGLNLRVRLPRSCSGSLVFTLSLERPG